MIITLVIGLPGSGKTTFVRNTKQSTDVCVDDPTDLNKVYQLCDAAYSAGNNVYISDPKLCVGSILRDAVTLLKKRYTTAELQFIFFENNPEQCIANARSRLKTEPHKTTENLIIKLSSQYRPNEVYEGNVVPVYF